MNGRAQVVLSRFPAHLDAPREGKQLAVVADAVARGLDDLSASLAGIRRAHRIGHADATADILLLGALHRIGAPELAPLDRRLTLLAAAAAQLRAAVDAADASARTAAAEALCDLLGIAGPAPRLALFAPPPPPLAPGAPPAPPPPPDLQAAAVALVDATVGLTGYVGRREAVRARVLAIAGIHARGNATVAALLQAAASALDLQVDDAAAVAYKATLRPVVSVTPEGTPGSTRYAYVVVARSRSKNVDRQSALAVTATGNASLSATDANLVSWAVTPDARDYLVFRVDNGADSAQVGLLTNPALDATVTSFRDEGQPASGALDPELDDALFHSTDRFWHAVLVRPRAPLLDVAATGNDVVGMEENPVRRESAPPNPPPPAAPTPAPRSNAELFPVYRRGFGRSLVRVEITGIGPRCMGPMLVNRDEGKGIGFVGAVPDGELLRFDEAGHATLSGADVTAQAFAWQGACFAADDDDPAQPRDFVFDGPGAPADRRAVFAVASPFDALDAAFVFPHAGDPLPVPGIGIGRTRFAFFVQEAHFSRLDESVDPAVVVPLSPRTHIGYLDASVFAPPPAAPAAAKVSLSWLEHEAYALRILLPRRYSLYDVAGEPSMAELVAGALERHRPAGVDLRVDYIDDRWVLGTGEVPQGATPDPILSLRGGTVLWTAPAPTP